MSVPGLPVLQSSSISRSQFTNLDISRRLRRRFSGLPEYWDISIKPWTIRRWQRRPASGPHSSQDAARRTQAVAPTQDLGSRDLVIFRVAESSPSNLPKFEDSTRMKTTLITGRMFFQVEMSKGAWPGSYGRDWVRAQPTIT